MNLKKYFIPLFFILLFSCASTPDEGVSFFLYGDDSIQYFFSSCLWHDEENKQQYPRVEADWLHRNFPAEGESEARTVLNFSVLTGPERRAYRKGPSALSLVSGENRLVIPTENIDTLYIDKDHSRFTVWFLTEDFDAFMATATEDIRFEFTYERDFSLIPEEKFLYQMIYYQEVLLGMDPLVVF